MEEKKNIIETKNNFLNNKNKDIIYYENKIQDIELKILKLENIKKEKINENKIIEKEQLKLKNNCQIDFREIGIFIHIQRMIFM